MDNPFLNKYDTEFEIPPFSKINNNHFIPAFLMGIDEHNKEIDSIINNSDKPSFENVIIALEKSGNLLDRTGAVFLICLDRPLMKKFRTLKRKYHQYYQSTMTQ